MPADTSSTARGEDVGIWGGVVSLSLCVCMRTA